MHRADIEDKIIAILLPNKRLDIKAIFNILIDPLDPKSPKKDEIRAAVYSLCLRNCCEWDDFNRLKIK